MGGKEEGQREGERNRWYEVGRRQGEVEGGTVQVWRLGWTEDQKETRRDGTMTTYGEVVFKIRTGIEVEKGV